MARIYLDQQPVKQAAPKQRVYLDQPKTQAPKQRVYLDNKPAPKQPQTGGFWRGVGNQLIKPVASASNFLEDIAKTAAYPIANKLKPGSFEDYSKKVGINTVQNQKDVWTGKNKRTYSTMMNEIASKESNPVLKGMQKTLGYGGDFILDPLNKVKILEATKKGRDAMKTGSMALSAADQAAQGQRALLQVGNVNILPSVGNKVLQGSTKLNDAIRSTKYGSQAVDALAKVSTAIRPSGVTRGEFKAIQDTTRAFKKASEYASSKAIEGAAEVEKLLRKSGADDATRSAVLHAVEKGDKSLVPKGMEEVFDKASAIKLANEKLWTEAGGATLENYGLPHVATDAVKEAQPTTNLRSGGKVYSPATGQDIHRQYVKADGKITNLAKDGIKYNKQTGKFYKMTSDKIKPSGVTDIVPPQKSGLALDDVVNAKKKTLAEIVKTEADEMMDLQNTTGGVSTIRTGNDFTPGDGYMRASNNPRWYSDFYKANGRPPGKKEILEMAKENLESGRGFLQEFYDDALKMDDTPSIDDLNAVLSGPTGKGVTKKEVLAASGKQSARRPVVVNVEQATAKEINEALVKQGKDGVFKEDLPTSLAVGGISSGRKAAGETFLRNTKGIKSDKGREIIDETYQRLTGNEAVGKALKAYDKVLGVWKAQILVAPSYHVRNEVGNIWNNYLANVTPVDMASAAKVQAQMATGKLDDATRALVTEMEQQGVTGGAQYGRDITQTVADEIGGASWNPLSQRFGLYKGNRALGTAFEDNARIAHYLAKRRDGFSPVEAAKSVDKFLFDYGDLTFIEQNVLKRALPFYTWASKNIPLQLSQFVKNPGKFSKAATLQKDIEEPISRPNERYMSEYVKNNSPMRIKTNADGTTEYLLLGQWIPAAQAIQFLSQPKDEILRGISPMVTIPSDLLNNRSFFKDTLGGEQPIERTPGELGSFLGFDMRKKLINVLRGIRVLNEIDKLNPGEIFGGKGKPSVFQGMAENASETRGLQHSPDSTQAARTLGFLLGKTSTYDPESSKIYYDRDTQDRMNEYTSQMQNALKLGQTDLAANILKEMEQFNMSREGKQNKHIQQYNLMGERYFQDLAKDKQAEYQREDTRKQMREMIREGLRSGKTEMLTEALQMDPTYAKQALKDALKEKTEDSMSDENKRLMYEVERMKTEKRLQPFYTP